MNKPSILIAGAGGTGAQLARRMCADWDVHIVDPNAEILNSESLACAAKRQVGDATSALVLKNAGIEEAQVVVATTDSDEKNVEVLRIAKEQYGVENLYAVMRDVDWRARYDEAGVKLVDRFQACAAMLASQIAGGQKVATNIGLGQGEIMEVEVLANSSVVGRRLMDLNPKRWLVGAVYRQGELIVPHGDTVLEAHDSVVVIGDPEILPSIAKQIGAGESKFPLHYGSRITALGCEALETLLPEVQYILDNTAAHTFKVIVDEGHYTEVCEVCEAAGIDPTLIRVDSNNRLDLADATSTLDIGLVVMESEPLPFLSRIGLSRSKTAKVIDRLRSPLMVCRGSFPYKKVLLVLAERTFDLDAAQLAIDLVRMLGAELHLAVVHQPALVVGAQLKEEVDEKRKQVLGLARMYNLSVDVVELAGNPIHEIVERSGDYQVVVLPYHRKRRSSLTNPDVAQNLIHRVKCSTLVMPCEGS